MKQKIQSIIVPVLVLVPIFCSCVRCTYTTATWHTIPSPSKKLNNKYWSKLLDHEIKTLYIYLPGTYNSIDKAKDFHDSNP